MIKRMMDKVVEHFGKILKKEKRKKHVVIFDISKSKRADIRERTPGDEIRCEEDLVFYGERDVKEAKIECIFDVDRGSK